MNCLLGVLSLWCVSNQNANAQINKLQDYENKKSAPIGTFQGINFKEGGFSGLFAIPNTNGKEFWTVSDRGVNVDAAKANLSTCRPTYDKIYGFPNYAPKIHRIKIQGDSIQILQTITIKRPNGTTATGLINPTGFGSTSTEVASTDTVQNCANFTTKTVNKDVWGIDSEGITVDKDGNFWICEEGGPTNNPNAEPKEKGGEEGQAVGGEQPPAEPQKGTSLQDPQSQERFKKEQEAADKSREDSPNEEKSDDTK